MILFDSHTHLNDERFDEDRPDAVKRMIESGVTRCVCAGSDRASSESAVTLAESYEGIYAAAGVHPEFAAAFEQTDMEWIGALALRPKTAAIGEIGLDYHYGVPRETQWPAFASQYAWAAAWDIPVILHIRDAHEDMLEALSAMHGIAPPQIILHCYSGDWSQAQRYLDMGCTISFAGNVTFKNARNLHECARKTPLDRLLIETDCPYLAPEPVRGKRNEPAYVSHTAAMIARLRGIPLEELAEASTANALRVFGIGGEG
ncbi:MAG: TatD family hydrolase [Oscillospiraceae bacterium]|jgi:TatD DNase family protein|nr:TatD family hydrolase [Oscillospiraceae bacterium]